MKFPSILDELQGDFIKLQPFLASDDKLTHPIIQAQFKILKRSQVKMAFIKIVWENSLFAMAPSAHFLLKVDL